MADLSVSSSNDIIHGKYILLDWNVIQYLKNPRANHRFTDSELCGIIESLRHKYYFPFCESHLRDLKRSFSCNNQQRVAEDLYFLGELSRCIALATDNNNIYMAKCIPIELFNQILCETNQPINIHSKIIPDTVVDMEKLDSDNPLRPFLEKTSGILVPELFDFWLNEKFKTFFDEISDYENFRKYIPKVKRDILSNAYDNPYRENLEYHISPFLDSLAISDIEELASIWKDIITTWLSLSFPLESIPYAQMLSTAYTLLDIHPLFREKLKKRKNTLDNIVRDSKLIFYAHSGEYLVTEDRICREKASFVFKAFDEKTKVFNMDEFLRRFS